MNEFGQVPVAATLSGAVGEAGSPEVPTAHLEQLVRGVADHSVAFETLVGALMPMINGTQTLPAEMALQLTTTLIELEQHAADEDKLYGLVNERGAPALALSEAGQILALNTAAAQLFHLSTGDGMRALGIERLAFDAFKRRLADTRGHTLIKAHRPEAVDALPLIMIGSYHPRYQAFVLEALQHHWPESIDLALKALFGLSRSEREILSCLAQGMSSEQIAKRRTRTLGTVRQQVKNILQKLGSSSQLEVATMAAAAAAKSSEGWHGDTGILTMAGQDAPLDIREFRRGRRRIGWRRFGDPGGEKVIMLHGPTFGAGEYLADRYQALRHGLDVYAIERPGYGRSDPPGKGEDVLECHYQDLLSLMAQAQLSKVKLLAYEVGMIPALKLAEQQPDRIKGIVAVSAAPPFIELEQLHAMPEHQVVFIQAARHAPWLARLMIRLLMIRTRQLGPERWIEVVFQGLKTEMQVMKKSELKTGIVGSYSFYLNQMGAGFEVDLKMMLKDWGGLLRGLSVRLRLLHGGNNATTPVNNLEIFKRLNPHVGIDLIENEGLTLAVSRPERIYQTLAQLDGVYLA